MMTQMASWPAVTMAIVVASGGAVGYLKSKSKASLIAGCTFGLLYAYTVYVTLMPFVNLSQSYPLACTPGAMNSTLMDGKSTNGYDTATCKYHFSVLVALL
jgi:uncharacterized membrane protein (UPF0136 family)